MVKIGGVVMSEAAAECVEETGIDPQDDVMEWRSGRSNYPELLAYCLDGAFEDRVQGWHDYVDAIEAHCDAAEVRS